MAYVFEDGEPAPGALGGGYVFEDEQPSTFRRLIADPALSALKGAIGVPEAAVGIADIATGGRAGKLAEEVGFRPKEAKAMLDELYSPEQRAATKEVSDADDFLETLAAALRNPSTIGHAAVESAPLMLGGGAVGRGVLKVAPRIAPLVAGALGEGTVSAGLTAEQIRQATADGLLTPAQAAIATGSGALTAGIGAGGGKLAQRLGITDIDTLIASGARQATTKAMPRRIAEGALSEGVIEELPQSMQEQAAQNLALEQPIGEGVPQAGAMGMLVGNVMGGGVGAFARRSAPMDAAREALQTTQEAAGPSPDMEAAPAQPGAATPLAGARDALQEVETAQETERAVDTGRR